MTLVAVAVGLGLAIVVEALRRRRIRRWSRRGPTYPTRRADPVGLAGRRV